MSLVTYTGKTIDYSNVTKEDIEIEDILYSLSRINRFVGHSVRPYSVLEHSIVCYFMAVSLGYSKREQLLCLIHDFPEAYVGDCPSPLKSLLPEFSIIEERIETAIFNKLDIEIPTKDEIKKIKTVDLTSLYCEMRDLTYHNQKVVDESLMNLEIAESFNLKKELKYNEEDIVKELRDLLEIALYNAKEEMVKQ